MIPPILQTHVPSQVFSPTLNEITNQTTAQVKILMSHFAHCSYPCYLYPTHQYVLFAPLSNYIPNPITLHCLHCFFGPSYYHFLFTLAHQLSVSIRLGWLFQQTIPKLQWFTIIKDYFYQGSSAPFRV